MLNAGHRQLGLRILLWPLRDAFSSSLFTYICICLSLWKACTSIIIYAITMNYNSLTLAMDSRWHFSFLVAGRLIHPCWCADQTDGDSIYSINPFCSGTLGKVLYKLNLYMHLHRPDLPVWQFRNREDIFQPWMLRFFHTQERQKYKPKDITVIVKVNVFCFFK